MRSQQPLLESRGDSFALRKILVAASGLGWIHFCGINRPTFSGEHVSISCAVATLAAAGHFHSHDREDSLSGPENRTPGRVCDSSRLAMAGVLVWNQ